MLLPFPFSPPSYKTPDRDASEERRRPASARDERKTRESDANRAVMELRKELADLRAAQDLRFAMLESNVSQLTSDVAFWKGRTQELEQRIKDKKEKKARKRANKNKSPNNPL